MDCTLHHGSPLMIDYTPSADVAAGDVVVVGELPLIAHRDIPDGRLGALAAGGGVYTIAKEAPAVITAGAALYWDAGDQVVTTTASTHKLFGFASAAAASADTTIRAIHRPGVPPSAG